MREYVDRKMEEDEHARKRRKGDEEEKGEVVCDKMNVEGDETMEERREKRKRGEVEDDDVMKRAKSREREMTEERKTWTMWKYDEVMNGEVEGWAGAKEGGQ